MSLGKHWIKGIVGWFNEKSGEGMIKAEDSQDWYYVHYSSIQTTNKWKSLKKNQTVKFKIYDDPIKKQAEAVIVNESGEF